MKKPKIMRFKKIGEPTLWYNLTPDRVLLVQRGGAWVEAPENTLGLDGIFAFIKANLVVRRHDR